MGDVHDGVTWGYNRRCQEGPCHCTRRPGSEEPDTGPQEGQKYPTVPQKDTSALDIAGPQISGPVSKRASHSLSGVIGHRWRGFCFPLNILV